MREGVLRKPLVSEVPTLTRGACCWFFLQSLNSGTMRIGHARLASEPGVSLALSDSTCRTCVDARLCLAPRFRSRTPTEHRKVRQLSWELSGSPRSAQALFPRGAGSPSAPSLVSLP